MNKKKTVNNELIFKAMIEKKADEKKQKVRHYPKCRNWCRHP